jgi:uncharacterized protein
MTRIILTKLVLALAAIIAINTCLAFVLCEGTLYLMHKPLNAKMRSIAENDARQFDSNLDSIQVTSFNGIRLAAWLITPHHPNGSTVILLHGHGDNRAGMLPFAPMFLRRGYSVLLPDARAHGESGGGIATFGLYESRDLSHWMDWLTERGSSGCVYGLGESMGAAILLQALANEPRFCAAVAEAPFSSLREVAYDRLGQHVGSGAWLGRTLFRPLIDEAFLIARLRYQIDFDAASPAKAAATTHVPILLIHGTKDFNIPLRHCEKILKHHLGVMEFWQVQGAGHTGALGTDPVEFEHRVADWFARYPKKPSAIH